MKIFINFFIACSLLNFSVPVYAIDIDDWSLAGSQQAGEEFLLYRLSFSGAITAFVWKDLADAIIVAGSKSHNFNRQKSCQLSLKLSTEDFLFAEFFAPTRYHWRTTVTPDLSRVLMFEEINENEDDVHRVTWLNKKEKQLEVFHKRKNFPIQEEELADDEYEDAIIETVWEADGKKKPPFFLLDTPKLEEGLDYLVYERSIKIKDNKPVFDPLAIIYSARWFDYDNDEKFDFVISYKDTFRQYQVFMEAKEKIEIGDKSVGALRIAIRRKPEEKREGEAYMLIWLSDDERRIPLQYLIEIKPGSMMLKIDAENFENYRVPVRCIKS